MNTKERKNVLIDWIKDLNNESILKRIEEFKSETIKDIPTEIIRIFR